MATPIRIQRKRTKGWKMPENTVYVGRGSPWGNPARVGHLFPEPDVGVVEDAAHATVIFQDGVECGLEGFPDILKIQQDLYGKNLACWCGLCENHKEGKPFDEECRGCETCHADLLGRIANAHPHRT
jgi:hypothetical protein